MKNYKTVLQKNLALAGLAGLLSLSGCGDLSAVSVEDSCSWVRPISVSDADLERASDALLSQVLIHNESWEDNC